MQSPGLSLGHAGRPHTVLQFPQPLGALTLAQWRLLRAGWGGARDILGLLLWSVFIVRILLEVELPQPLGLIDVLLLLTVRKGSPLLAKVLGDLRIVGVRVLLDDLPSLQLRPSHEGIHGALDMILFVLAGLK